MNIRFVFPYLFAAMLSAAAYAQTPASYATHATQPEIISDGTKLKSRSNLTPYPSREEALSQAEESIYTIDLNEWETDNIPGGKRYSTRFKKNFSWDNRAVILRLDDVSSSFQVTVNDSLAGYSQAGMGRSEFDITKLTKSNYNTITITLFSEAAARRIEQGRKEIKPSIGKVAVISQPTVRIHDVFTKSSTDGNTAYVKIDVVTESILLNPKEYVIAYELIDPSGKTVSTFKRELHTRKHSCDTTSFVAMVESPHKWNHETPNLYTLLVTSRNDGRIVEYVALRIGLRNIGYSPEGITVDGIPVSLHAARYSANAAAELTAVELRQLKNQGYNTIITDLRPQPEYLYTLCDKMGLYICNEADIDDGSSTAITTAKTTDNSGNSPKWVASYVDRATAAYYRAHIHPSVIIYSPARNSTNGYSMYEAYNAIKSADSDVAILYFGADGQWNTDLTASALHPAPATESGTQKNISVMMNEANDAVIIRNNRSMTQISGTYKIAIKKGHKKLAIYTDSFSLDRLGTMEIAVPQAAQLTGKGSVEVELQTLKQGVRAEKASEISTGKNLGNTIGGVLGEKLSDKLGVETTPVITVGDVYDIYKETLPL